MFPNRGSGNYSCILIIALFAVLLIAALAAPPRAGAAKRPPARKCVVVVANVRQATEGVYLASVNGVDRYVLPRSARRPWLAEGRYTCAGFRQRYSVR